MKTAPSLHALALLAAGGMLLFSDSRAAPADEPLAGFVMGYFTGSPKGSGNSWSLHLAISEDGLRWVPLNQGEPVLVPALGRKGLRDPFFLSKQDGGFLVMASNEPGDNPAPSSEIHVWDTGDFITFQNARLLKLHADDTLHTLAPEAFYDPGSKQYGIIWSGGTAHPRIYVNFTTDFINVSPSQVYFDPGHEVLDATLRYDPAGDTGFLYYRDAQADRLRGTRTVGLAPGGFEASPYIKPLGGKSTQAPLLVKAPHQDLWHLFSGSDAWQTTDIRLDAWQEVSKRDYNLPLNSRHPTVVPVTRVELDGLIGHWGGPLWHRLQAYNFPDRFVRHENFQCKISHYPFDPYEDSQWRLVPGLVDAKGVSFEAINLPGYYLRTVAGHVVLAKNDGSNTFKSRATFIKVPGLGDAAWSSFQAFSSPDLYLRHLNYILRLEPVKSPAEKEDATFRIVY